MGRSMPAVFGVSDSSAIARHSVKSWRVRSLVQALALVLVSTAVFLCVAECAARLARRLHASNAGLLREYIQLDPRLGHRHRPGAHAVIRNAEYSIEVQINSKGLRDGERDYAAAPGTFRILAIGDSFVEGLGVEANQDVTAVLQAELRAAGHNADVINGGTQGIAPIRSSSSTPTSCTSMGRRSF
jgi:hypothetical protein